MRTEGQIGNGPALATERLNSWKEIASFFDKDVRTVRRWEAMRRLPIHRVPGGGRSGVFAYVSELERWLAEPEGQQARGEGELSSLSTAVDTEAYPQNNFPAADGQSADPSLANSPLPAAADPPDTVDTDRNANPLVPEAPERRRASDLSRPQSRRSLLIAGLILSAAVVVTAAIMVRRHTLPQRTAVSSAEAQNQPGGKPSANAEAQDLYLRGLSFWEQRTETSLTQAIDLFTQSIVHDPHFAAAYAGLADSYILLRQYGHMTDGEAFPRALAASQQALALDDSSHQAHRAYAFILNYWMWNFPEAQKEFERAIQLSPNDAQTHSWYATSLFSIARYQQAMYEIDTARRLAPESISILTNRGLLLSEVDKDAGRAYLLELEKLNPGFANVHRYLADSYLLSQDYSAYLDESERAAALVKDPAEVAELDRARRELDAHGPAAMLRQQAAAYGRAVDEGRPLAMQPAALYARLGDADRTLHYLKLAADRHESNFPLIDHDPIYRFLDGRPDFSALLAVRNTPLDLATALKMNPSASAHLTASR